MAREKTSKSAAVRALLTENPDMPAKELIAALASEGLRVKPGLIYLVRSEMRRKQRRQVRRSVAKVAGNGPSDPVDLIRRIRGLASEVGGYGKLRELVDVLGQ
jgi:hypothetical protein